MKILVTGHKGFIGGHLFSALEENGYSPVGFDVGDELKDQPYDYIFHFAARGLIRKSIEKPYEYFLDDLGLTLKFLEMARKNGSTIIFPTSGSVAEPTNPYSLSKKQSVEWIKLYGKLYDIDHFILKFYNIYGEGSRKGAVYLFTKAAVSGEKALVYGKGDHIRDFFNVRDVVRGCLKIINKEITPGEYEFGSGTGTSVEELISRIKEVTGLPIEVEHKDYMLAEAERLVASEPILADPMPLKEGIKQVKEFIEKDSPSGS